MDVRQRFEAARAQPDQRLAHLIQELTEVRERQAQSAARAAAELAEFARTDDAPRELRAVQERIDRGQLTWDGVVFGGGAYADTLRTLLGDRLAMLPEALEEAQDLVTHAGLTPQEAARRAVAALVSAQEEP